MFIKLTRFDNRPIWLNASFIVTVEPRKDGAGSTVVPIGDGFDYDVRESVQEVLAKLDGAPAAAVVPVPASDCLTKTPDDVSPEPEPGRDQSPSDGTQPAEKTSAEKKPRKRTVRKPKSEKPEKAQTEHAAEKTEMLSLELSDDQIARLVKLAPKTVAKLKNTLATQFHVADVGATVLSLEAKKVFAVDGNRILWPAPSV